MSSVVLRRFCEQCSAYREPHQTRSVGPERSPLVVCGSCGGVLRTEAQRIAEPLPRALVRAHLYPFAPAIAVSIAVTGLVSAFAAYVPLIGGLLSATIAIGFVFLVLRASAEGRDDLAVDTEIAESLVDWFAPLVRYLLTWVVCFAPAGFALFALGWPAGAAPAAVLGVLGLGYFPAGIIVAAHGGGCVGPLNPVPGVQLIARIPGAYFMTFAFLVLTLVLGFGVVAVAQRLFGGIPFLGPALVRVLGLVAPVIMARQLGILVHEHRELL